MKSFELMEWYENIWDNVDHRVDGWPFMSSVIPIIILIIGALIMGIYGPIYMKNKPPIKLTKLMIPLNLALVIWNLYIGLKLLNSGIKLNYNWICHPCDSTAKGGEEMEVVKVSYLFFLLKLVELYDSFFLILRKTSNIKISVLIFHHVVTVILVWTIARWVPTGSIIFLEMFVSFAHSIFYAYYALSVVFPHFSKNKYVKLSVTIFAIMQFVFLFIYMATAMWFQCPVGYWVIQGGALLIFIMFSFYVFEVLMNWRKGIEFQISNYTSKLMTD